MQVLRDFNVPDHVCPATPERLDTSELSSLLLEWVQRCRDEEEAMQAFEAAEYVEVLPSFADCTGRYVDVVVPRLQEYQQ